MKTYKDIVPDYEQYVDLQVIKYESYESDHPEWNMPQEEALIQFFENVPRNYAILDAACGDGFGLEWFRENHFTNVVGVELNQNKAITAIMKGHRVIQEDLHKLVSKPTYNIIYSSHTLEHCYDPGLVLDNFYQMLKPKGRLFIIVPYPDGGVEDAHGGKYDLGTYEEDGFVKIRKFLFKHDFTVDDIVTGFRAGGEIRVWARKMPRHEPAD